MTFIPKKGRKEKKQVAKSVGCGDGKKKKTRENNN